MMETQSNPQQPPKKLIQLLNVYSIIGIAFIVITAVFLLIPTVPYVWYRLNDRATEDEVNQIATAVEDTSNPSQPPEETVLPPFDPTLTSTNTLIISTIGVNGEIHEGVNASAALDLGIWRVPEFGTPEDSFTVILAAHRFGYISWTNEFRTLNSFYNLPRTGVGDTLQIIWNQRRYEYRIYKAEDAESINDYSADLILYTCRMFNSPVRVFRYAERVN